MLFEMLILFIIVVVICLILTVYTMDEYPSLAIVFIMIGIIFSIFCTYGMWNVEYFYIGYNATHGNTSAYVHSITNYGDPYSYIFVLLVFVFCILFVKTGFNMWHEALKQKGEIDYKLKDKRWK